MPSEEKIEKVILQIIRETTNGSLEWESSTAPPSLSYGTNDIVNDFYEADYKGQRVAVFERRYQNYDGDRDVMYWTSRDCLAFIGLNRSVTWETSQPSWRIATLLEVARESASDVDEILDSLLK